MKDVNKQDISAPKSAEDLRRRYKLNVTKHLTAKQTSNGTAIGIGKKASIGKGLDVAGDIVTDGGFFDTFGREIFSAKEISAAELDKFDLASGLYVVRDEGLTGLNDSKNYHYVEILSRYLNDSNGYSIQRAWAFSSGVYDGVWIRMANNSSWVTPLTKILKIPNNLIWSGSWISGSISCNVSDYSLFIFITDVTGAAFLGIKNNVNNTIVGINAATSTSLMALRNFWILISETTLTLHYFRGININANSSASSVTDTLNPARITHIYGVA